MLEKLVRKSLHQMGYSIKKTRFRDDDYPIEASDADVAIIGDIVDSRLSGTSIRKQWATLSATRYACTNNIPGDFVECGVFKGGNSIIAAKIIDTLKADKKVIMFDTFTGMTAPTEADIKTATRAKAQEKFNALQKDDHNEWCYSTRESVQGEFVKRNIDQYTVFVEGDVLKTLEVGENLPDQISVLRLDTDWYESTLKELEVLYPRLAPNGILLIDDYGVWDGARKAVEEYFADHTPRPIMWVTDHAGRSLQKPGAG